MKALRLLALSLWPAVAALPSAAQQSAAVCEASWAIVAEAIPAEVSAAISVEGPLCVASDVAGRAGAVEIAVSRITWDGQGLGQFASDRVPPRSLVLAVEGARSVALTGDPRTDYLLRAQAVRRAISGRLELRWDGLTNRLFLDALSFDFPGENLIRMTGQAGGVNLSTMSALRTSLGSAVLNSLTVDVTTFGLFETYLLGPLVLNGFAPGADPAEEMAGLFDRLAEQVDALPDTSVAPESKAALIDFLGDLPNPGGDLRLTVTADPPLGWVRLAPNLLGSGRTPSLDALFDGVRIRFEYVSRPPAE